MERTEGTMTTYKMADGNPVADEFGWVTDLDYFEDDEEPVALVREVWHRVSVETYWHLPDRVYSCTKVDDCDEDAVEWEQQPDGRWVQTCREHAEEPS